MSYNNIPCRLYLITPPEIHNIEHFSENLKYAIDGGDIASLQLRLKAEDGATPADKDLFLRASEVLLPICHQNEVAFIINDLPEIIHETGADGIHIGMDSLTAPKKKISKIRMQVGDSIIVGASCYNSDDYAVIAAEQNVDYVSFGAFYPTTSKKNPVQADAEILEWWSQNSILPCVAIGGITPDNLEPLVRSGADFIAALSGVWNHPEGPKIAVQQYNQAIEEALEKDGITVVDDDFFTPNAVNDNAC